MKFLHCHSHSTFSLRSRRFVFVGEEYDTSLESAAEAVAKEAEASETEIKAEALSGYTSRADTAMEGAITGMVGERKRAADARVTELETLIGAEKNPAKKKPLEAERDVKKKESEDLAKPDGAFRKELMEAKKRALGKIKERIEAVNTKIEEEAKKFADQAKASLSAQLATAAIKERTDAPEANFETMKGKVDDQGDFITVSMPRYATVNGKKTNINERAGSEKGTMEWDEDKVLTMVTEAIQTIYIEQGKEAAEAKLAELKQNLAPNAVGEDDVNFDCLRKTFGGKGGFDYALWDMEFDTNKDTSPKRLGHVIGKMTAASALFTGDNEKYFGEYEKYVQEAMKDERMGIDTDLLSPSEWAKDHAPELLVKPADRDQLIGQVLDRINMPPESDKKAYEEASKRRAAMQEYLWGLLNGEPDSKKWDGLVKAALGKMLDLKDGAEIDFTKLNDFNYEDKLDPGADILGDSNGALKGWTRNRAFIAGMIDAAILGYKGKKVKVGDKEVDFADHYREHVKHAFTDGGPMYKAIRDAKDTWRDAKDEVRGRNPRLSPDKEAEEIAALDAVFHNAVGDALMSDKVSWASTIYDKAEKVGEEKEGDTKKEGDKEKIFKEGKWIDASQGDTRKVDNKEQYYDGKEWRDVARGDTKKEGDKEKYYDGKEWRDAAKGDTRKEGDKEKYHDGKEWRDAKQGDKRKVDDKDQVYNGKQWVDVPAAPPGGARIAGGAPATGPAAVPGATPGGRKGPEMRDDKTPAERWENFAKSTRTVATKIADAVAQNADDPSKIPDAVKKAAGTYYSQFQQRYSGEYLLPSGVGIKVGGGKVEVAGYAPDAPKKPANPQSLPETWIASAAEPAKVASNTTSPTRAPVPYIP